MQSSSFCGMNLDPYMQKYLKWNNSWNYKKNIPDIIQTKTDFDTDAYFFHKISIFTWKKQCFLKQLVIKLEKRWKWNDKKAAMRQWKTPIGWKILIGRISNPTGTSLFLIAVGDCWYQILVTDLTKIRH